MTDVFGGIVGDMLSALSTTFGTAIEYRPKNGAVLTGITTVARDPDPDSLVASLPAQQHSRRFDILVADLPITPSDGDEIRTATGRRYIVQRKPERDLQHKLWIVYAFEEPA